MSTKGIIIHCSDTYPDMDIGLEEIRDWHVNQNGWSDVGYHRIIRRDGTIEDGRPLSRDGAHARGYNHFFGICMVGGKAKAGQNICNFTHAQWLALEKEIIWFMVEYGITVDSIMGHNQVSDKLCPTFDVPSWIAKGF